jgi:alpha-L-rhamnosidase
MNTKSMKFLPAKFLLALSVLFAISCSSGKKGISVYNLRCEYLENPIGLDIVIPRFSWNLVSDKRSVMQSAYRIIVSDDRNEILQEKGSIWDSGKEASDSNVNITYEGTPLESGLTYYWSVCVWDQNGNQSSWSEPANFHTGVLNSSEWKASWIMSGDTSMESPLLRKEFTIEKSISRAFAYVTGLGYYELYLNGRKVGDHVLDPGMTDYKKRVLYSTFDVTENLKKGKNAAGAILGNGAVNLKKIDNRYSWASRLGSRPPMSPRFFLQLEVIFKDGTKQVITSDNTWKSSASPVIFNNVYGGEDYDARLEQQGWSEAGFDDSSWNNVKNAGNPGGMLQSQMMPPVRVTATFKPVAQTNPSKGVYLYDMGQNYAGWWRIKVRGEEGTRVRVRGAETLNDSLFPSPLKEGDKLSIKQKYHSQVWTDYTLKGKGTEVYEPKFFYTGLRYVEVTTDTPEKVKIEGVEGRVVGTNFEINGNFVTSDSLLNKIHRATVWAQKGNTHSYPTDCPHREKGGYTGDGEIIAEASIHDFQMAAFYRKWLNDMEDAQEENGRIPNTSPTLIGGSGGGVAWGSAYILVPWWMYQYYNDTRILEEHYNTMKKYVGYLHKLARTDSDPKQPYIINDFNGYWYSLGEWCAPGQSDLSSLTKASRWLCNK